MEMQLDSPYCIHFLKMPHIPLPTIQSIRIGTVLLEGLSEYIIWQEDGFSPITLNDLGGTFWWEWPRKTMTKKAWRSSILWIRVLRRKLGTSGSRGISLSTEARAMGQSPLDSYVIPGL